MQDLLTYAVRYSSSQLKEMDIKKDNWTIALDRKGEYRQRAWIHGIQRLLHGTGFGFESQQQWRRTGKAFPGCLRGGHEIKLTVAASSSDYFRHHLLSSSWHLQSDQYYMNDKGVACRDNENQERTRSQVNVHTKEKMPAPAELWWGDGHLVAHAMSGFPQQPSRTRTAWIRNIPLCRLIQEADRNAANQSVKKRVAMIAEPHQWTMTEVITKKDSGRSIPFFQIISDALTIASMFVTYQHYIIQQRSLIAVIWN